MTRLRLLILYLIVVVVSVGAIRAVFEASSCPPHPGRILLDAIRDGDEPAALAILRGPYGRICAKTEFAGGETPLTHAAWFGRITVVRRLLEIGVDPGHANTGAETALHYAVIRFHSEIARLLVDAGVDPDPRENEFGYAPLHYAAGLARLDLVRILLRANANADLADHAGMTAVMHALHGGHPTAVAVLAQAGADPNLTDGKGETALHYAAHRKFAASIRLLIANGADVNARNHFGETPLMIAAKSGSMAVAKVLLRSGANPRIRDCRDTYDAFSLAETAGQEAMIRLIKAYVDPAASPSVSACESDPAG